MFKCSTLFKISNKYIPVRCCSTVSQWKKICIVGSGPAGFYTAKDLLKGNKDIEIDIYEKLPTPFGLIRYGVAPDHPQIKSVTRDFEKTAMHERCNFYGNVNVGEDIKVHELLNAYHAIVLAYGAQNDKRLGIPGEDCKNVLSAREFVSWYNGHPKFVNLQCNLDTECVVVIGHGNVAIDVSRILLQDIDKLKTTDIAEHAIETLKKSKVKRVIVAGRRGPLQALFSPKEFREMTVMPNCNCIMNPTDFTGISELIPTLPRKIKRVTDLMFTTANNQQQNTHEKSIEVKFCRKPKTILSDSQGRVEKVVFGINKIKKLDFSQDEIVGAEIVNTDEEEVINCGLVLKSIGYQSTPIDPSVPFDENAHIIPNYFGKVKKKKGMYCSGWIQMGPKGVIAPTVESSQNAVAVILNDIKKGNLETNPSMKKSDLLELLKKRGVKFVTFEDWKKIDKVEVERGIAKGKPREKIGSIEEMLNIANVA